MPVSRCRAIPKDFEDALKANQNMVEWLLVTEVSEEIFKRYFLESQDQPFSFTCTYDRHLEVLLLSMAISDAHQTARFEFHHLLRNATSSAGVELRTRAGFRSTQGGGKMPDGAWRPLHPPPGQSSDWPSAVLEVSYSETRAKLMNNIRHWFWASGGDVKVVFTVDIERRAPKVIIEQWVDMNGWHRPEQQITISKSSTGAYVSGPLEVSFERLFLRSPTPFDEAIIRIREDALIWYAQAIWQDQGFEVSNTDSGQMPGS